MATAVQIVDSLLVGFEHQDHPPVQAAWNHLIILIEMYYKPGDDATPQERVRYDAVREALNTFRVNPLSAIDRLLQELHDIDPEDDNIAIAVHILMETIERVTTMQPIVSPDAPSETGSDPADWMRFPPMPSAPAPAAPPAPAAESAPPPPPQSSRGGLGGLFGKKQSTAPLPEDESVSSASPAPPVGRAAAEEKKKAHESKIPDRLEDADTAILVPREPEPSAQPLEVETIRQARRQKFITDTGTFEQVISDDDTAEIPAVKPEGEGASAAGTHEAQFSAYFPPHIRRGNSYGLYVYAHTIEALQTIQQNVSQFEDRLGGQVPDATTAESRAMLKYGTALTVVPESDHAIFDPPQQTRTWNNEWIRFEFDFVSQVVQSNTLDIRLSIQVAGIEIAHIDCDLMVSDTGDGAHRSINPLADARLHSVTSRMYQKIFVSYSRQDDLIAERYRLAQQAAGQDVFMDSYSIRAGEDWQAALARAIDEADIFQLFWSPNSARSDNVRNEWEYALGYRCPENQCVTFIRPVYWQKPLTSPPPELSHLNFRYVPFNGTDAEPAAADPVASASSQVMARLDSLDVRLSTLEESLEYIKQALRTIYKRVR
jgi:hypothetical protein